MTVLYRNDEFSILVLATKKQYPSFLKKIVFQKICFKVQLLSDIYYEQSLELFLTEYINNEMRRGKRRPAGYVTSSKAIPHAKKKRGLTLKIEDSNDEMNKDNENETAPKVISREDLTEESSNDSLLEDSESD